MSYKKAVFWLHIAVPVLIAALSLFVVSDLVTRPGYTGAMIASIEESREDAMKLAASSTAVSVAITALPGDLATPVAEELSELVKGFMLVLCALYLEKFLISVTGVMSFQWLIPIACGIYVAGFLAKRGTVKKAAVKILCFALAVFLIIPAGSMVSDLIREQYGKTIEETIQSAENCAGQMEESVKENDPNSDAGNGLSQILDNLQRAGDTIAKGTSEFMRYLEKLVSSFIEAIAVMIVTSCVIPLLVVLCFVWIFKLIFGVDLGKLKGRVRRDRSGPREVEEDEDRAAV